ncbi:MULTISPECIES: ATP-binding protein [unclassified Janibacter]|uniref:ATP-binding protein n=1 Tax=unclassified Janibacter TaxID=2649294 RepID=UPI003D05BE01
MAADSGMLHGSTWGSPMTGEDRVPVTGEGRSSAPRTDEFGGVVGSGTGRTIRAAWRASSVGRVRHAIAEDLRARGVSETIVEEAEIVTSELLSNAIRHARPLGDHAVRIRWKVKGDVVEVEVTDGGSTSTPRPVSGAVWALSGRGLRIVRSLAHEWGVSDSGPGVTVWASLGGPSRRRAGS